MSRIDDLLRRQAYDLASMQEAEARRVVRALDDARRQVREQMEALRVSGGDRVQRFTAQHLRVVHVQLESAIGQLTARLTTEGDASASVAARVAYRDMLAVIRANEREFTDAGNRIEYRVVSRLTQEQGLLLHRYSYRRYSADLIAAIQRELAAGTARGLTIPQLTARIAATDDSVFSVRRGRAELIARCEMNTAYNSIHQASLEEAAAVLDDPGQTEDRLQRQANEFFDSRTCAFSMAIDGMVTDIGKPWRVPVARVDAATKGGRHRGGVVWPIVGGEYVVGGYMCHYNDRGRQVPFRESWAEDMPRAAESAALAVPVRMAA